MVLNKIIAFFIVHEKISLTGERKYIQYAFQNVISITHGN